MVPSKVSKLILVFAAALNLGLATNVSAGDDAVVKEYHDAMASCAFQNVTQLDDRISSAAVVGDAVFDQCKGQHFDLWQAFANQKGKSYVEGYVKAQTKWMVGLVLYVRAHPDEINDATKSKAGGLY
jgi:hypothetical protein